MHEHVYRMVVAGDGGQAIAGTSRGLLYHPAHGTRDHYTGILIVTPEARLAVLEGARAPVDLYRDALALAGLSSALTLLQQPTTFRWFSALLMQRFDDPIPDFTLAGLTALCQASPRELCTYVSTLALRARAGEIAHPRIAPELQGVRLSMSSECVPGAPAVVRNSP